MFLHSNDFVLYREGGKTVILKIRILGEVVESSEQIKFIPRPDFWDSSKCKDPTKRACLGAQIHFYNTTPEELEKLELLKINVTTDQGTPIKRDAFKDEHGYVIEYLSYYPLTITVENRLINQQTIFEVSWDRYNHYTSYGDYVFKLRVHQHQNPL